MKIVAQFQPLTITIENKEELHALVKVIKDRLYEMDRNARKYRISCDRGPLSTEEAHLLHWKQELERFIH